MNIGQRIAEARQAQGLSQRALARLAGVSVSAVNMIERGTRPNPSAELLRRVAVALNTTVDALLGDQPDPKAPMRGRALVEAVA